jgi:hypothetical protein
VPSQAVWPTSLPQRPLLKNFREEPGGNRVIRTEMEKGPAKTREWSRAEPSTIGIRHILDSNQLDTFRDFYNNSLASGANWFTIPHPVDGTTVDARMKGGWQLSSLAPNVHVVDFDVEVL